MIFSRTYRNGHNRITKAVYEITEDSIHLTRPLEHRTLHPDERGEEGAADDVVYRIAEFGPPPCKHWKDIGHRTAGKCATGVRAGDRVAHKVCHSCIESGDADLDPAAFEAPKCRYWKPGKGELGVCSINLIRDPTKLQCWQCLETGRKSRGFGDTLAKFFYTIGFRQRKTCACLRRQNGWNMVWRYRRGGQQDVLRSDQDAKAMRRQAAFSDA